MAKGKHAAALFEVINKGKTLNRPATPSAMRTPDWWFKGQQPAAPASGATPAPLPADSPTIPGRAPGTDIQVDPDRQEIRFRLTYTSAGILAFTVLVIVVLAYLIGKQTTPKQVVLNPDQNTPDLRQKPARTTVLNPTQPESLASDPSRQGLMPGAAETAGSPQPPITHVVQDTTRRVALNYIIVQSYKDKETAQEAQEFLKQNGIDTTIEKDPPGWAKTKPWYCVMGTTGFSRLSGAEYDTYLKRLKDVSGKFAPASSWKAFNPQGYKWGKQD